MHAGTQLAAETKHELCQLSSFLWVGEVEYKEHLWFFGLWVMAHFSAEGAAGRWHKPLSAGWHLSEFLVMTGLAPSVNSRTSLQAPVEFALP